MLILSSELFIHTAIYLIIYKGFDVMRKMGNKITAIMLASALTLSAAVLMPQKNADTVSAVSLTTGSQFTGFVWQSADHNFLLYLSITSETEKTASISGCVTWEDITNVIIPPAAEYEGVTYTVTGIGEDTFKDQTNLYSVSGMENVREIGDNAFSGCSNLSGFNFTNITSIGRNAFNGCVLIDLLRPNNLSSLGEYAFNGCTGLESVDFSTSSVTELPDFAFADCVNLKSILMPQQNFHSIGKSAFAHCGALEYFYIPTGTEAIGESAFSNCRNLNRVNFPQFLSSVGSRAFDCCPLLEYAAIDNPSALVGTAAFGYSDGNKLESFIVYGNGGNIKKYAEGNGFTYRGIGDVSTAFQRNEDFRPYMWKFTNTGTKIGTFSEASQNYEYSYTDEHLAFAESNGTELLKGSFDDACTGMASLTVMAASGKLDLKAHGEKYEAPCDITTPDSYVKSLISYAQSTCADKTEHTFSGAIFLENELVENCRLLNYDNPMRVDIKPEDSEYGHCVVAYGFESGKDALIGEWNFAECDGVDFNARILIYDVNYTYISNRRHIYINTETGDWYIPTSAYGYSLYSYVDSSGRLQSNTERLDFTYECDKLLKSELPQ